jgi:hypothetical protein
MVEQRVSNLTIYAVRNGLELRDQALPMERFVEGCHKDCQLRILLSQVVGTQDQDVGLAGAGETPYKPHVRGELEFGMLWGQFCLKGPDASVWIRLQSELHWRYWPGLSVAGWAFT